MSGHEHALAHERALVRPSSSTCPSAQIARRPSATAPGISASTVVDAEHVAPASPAVAAHWTGMSSGMSVTVAGSSPPPGSVALPRSVIRRTTRAVSSPVWSSRVARSRTSPAVTLTVTSASSAEVRGSPGRTPSRALATDADGRPFASGVPTVSAGDSGDRGVARAERERRAVLAVGRVAGPVSRDQRDPQRRRAARARVAGRLDPDRARHGLDRAARAAAGGGSGPVPTLGNVEREVVAGDRHRRAAARRPSARTACRRPGAPRPGRRRSPAP